MTAPLTDAQAAQLREAAQKATPGPWKHTTYMSGTQNVEYPGSRGMTFTDQVLASDASAICYESDAQPLPFINISHRQEDQGEDIDPQRSLNAAYIALANPANILALLDERERVRTAYVAAVKLIGTERAERDALRAERDAAERARNESGRAWRESFNAMHERAMTAEADVSRLRMALERICLHSTRHYIHGNGAFNDVVPPYLIDEGRAALTTKGTAE